MMMFFAEQSGSSLQEAMIELLSSGYSVSANNPISMQIVIRKLKANGKYILFKSKTDSFLLSDIHFYFNNKFVFPQSSTFKHFKKSHTFVAFII